MPTILLIRHAQASFGTADYDVLSEQGEAQVAALAARGIRADRLVSGSLRRQRDTAAPWTAADAVLEIDPRFDEYDARPILADHAGVQAGLERGAGEPELDSRGFQQVLDGALERWIASGAWHRFRDRVTAGMDDLAGGLDRGETAAVFTSGGVIAACCVRALGLDERAFVAFNRVVVNAAVTKLAAGRSGLSLVSFNDHAHLEAGGLVTYR